MQAARRRLKKKRAAPNPDKKKTPGTSCNVSFNGENVKSVDVTVSQEADGFFNENIKSILESKRTINDIITQIQKEQDSKAQEYNKRKGQLQEFLEEMKVSQQSSVDNSFEVRWSLQELENIVYDFVNFHIATPSETSNDKAPRLEALKEDVMRVQKRDKQSSDMLPSVVRELILKDRGYSIYLSESFNQLPSPVSESLQLKKCFKNKDDEDTHS